MILKDNSYGGTYVKPLAGYVRPLAGYVRPMASFGWDASDVMDLIGQGLETGTEIAKAVAKANADAAAANARANTPTIDPKPTIVYTQANPNTDRQTYTPPASSGFDQKTLLMVAGGVGVLALAMFALKKK